MTTFYEELFRDLDQSHVRYLVVGGVAVLLHGFIRATADLDLIVALDPNNLKTFLSLMKDRGYKPKAPVPIEDFSIPEKREYWVKEKGMKVFSLFHPQKPMELIDIFVQEQIPFETAYSRRKTVFVGNTPVSLIHMNDLITLKQMAGRPQDLQDIDAMKERLKNEPKS